MWTCFRLEACREFGFEPRLKFSGAEPGRKVTTRSRCRRGPGTVCAQDARVRALVPRPAAPTDRIQEVKRLALCPAFSVKEEQLFSLLFQLFERCYHIPLTSISFLPNEAHPFLSTSPCNCISAPALLQVFYVLPKVQLPPHPSHDPRLTCNINATRYQLQMRFHAAAGERALLRNRTTTPGDGRAGAAKPDQITNIQHRAPHSCSQVTARDWRRSGPCALGTRGLSPIDRASPVA